MDKFARRSLGLFAASCMLTQQRENKGVFRQPIA
jgi:hypothetical protein